MNEHPTNAPSPPPGPDEATAADEALATEQGGASVEEIQEHNRRAEMVNEFVRRNGLSGDELAEWGLIDGVPTVIFKGDPPTTELVGSDGIVLIDGALMSQSDQQIVGDIAVGVINRALRLGEPSKSSELRPIYVDTGPDRVTMTFHNPQNDPLLDEVSDVIKAEIQEEAARRLSITGFEISIVQDNRPGAQFKW